MSATDKKRPPITKWLLNQSTYNQPEAAIAAYEQFKRQPDWKTNGHLLILDSSALPNRATKFYEEINDPHVTYLHIPVHPGKELPKEYQDEFLERFPKAYRWMRDKKLHAIYTDTIPDDAELKRRYKSEADIPETLRQYDTKTFEAIYKHPLAKDAAVPAEAWAKAVDAYPFQDRPYLGSKRNFATRFAKEMGAQAVINLDDDWIGPGYVQSQIHALKDADFTGKMSYVTLLHTEQMKTEGKAPIWATADLNNDKEGFLLDFNGNEKVDPVTKERLPFTKQRSMGWTQARRVDDAMPKVPDILGGEDRAFEDRIKARGLTVNLQNNFSKDAVRLVFGGSNSDNVVSEVLDPKSDKLPAGDKREEIVSYMEKLRADMSRPKNERIEFSTRSSRNGGWDYRRPFAQTVHQPQGRPWASPPASVAGHEAPSSAHGR